MPVYIHICYVYQFIVLRRVNRPRDIVYVAVEVLGASTRVGHRSVHTAFLHVVTHQVTTWALCSLYKE